MRQGENHGSSLGGEMAAKRILVVDDNRLIRVLVAAALKPLGCEIIEAADGGQAIEAALECRPDLILLDVVMPVASGFEVLTTLREHPDGPACPIIMLTTSSTDKDIDHALDHGANAYVVKPFEHADLRHTVERLLNA